MPIISNEWEELALLVGQAVWQTQVLETALGIHLVMVHKLTTGTARAEVEAMFVRTEKRTLGQLFENIRDTGATTLLPRLERFAGERNWLVHRSRHEGPKDLRANRVKRIQSIVDEASSLTSALQQAAEDHLMAHGLTKAEVDARADAISHEWTTDA